MACERGAQRETEGAWDACGVQYVHGLGGMGLRILSGVCLHSYATLPYNYKLVVTIILQ